MHFNIEKKIFYHGRYRGDGFIIIYNGTYQGTSDEIIDLFSSSK